MIYTLGTVTAAGSAPFYTNPTLFKTAASHNASAHNHHHHGHPHNITTTTVTITVPYVVATGYDQRGDFTEGENTTLKYDRLPSSPSFTEEMRQRAAPVNSTHVNASGLKKAILSGLSISIVLILALLVVFLLFYFQKLRCGRRSRGDPLDKRRLSCGPSSGARPSAPATTEAPPSTQEALPKETGFHPETAASTPLPPFTPLAITQPSTPVTYSILPPSLPNIYPVKPIRKTGKKTLAEELGCPLSPVSPVSPRRKNKTVTWTIDRALTREHSETEDEDLDLPELHFESVPRYAVPSPVLLSPPSSFTAEICEPEGPSDEGKRFHETMWQSKKGDERGGDGSPTRLLR